MSEALLTIVDSNYGNPGDGIRDEGYLPSKQYETEAIQCFQHWREKAGRYKDIPIYAMQVTETPISRKTLEVFQDLNVTYIHRHLPEINSYDCGYFYVPFGCEWLENNIKEQLLIHIDLDMILLQEPPPSLFYIQDAIAKIAIIKGKDRNKRFYVGYPINFNTCFIVSFKRDKFYSKWADAIRRLVPSKDECANDRIFSEWEEHVVDKMYFDEGVKIEVIDRIMIGEFWEPIDSYDDRAFENIYFIHDHYGTNARWKSMIEYEKRRLSIDQRKF
jgi:hypothetical protein